MTADELALLHSECVQHDHDSAALLEAYLDRVHGTDWRTRQRTSDTRAPSDSRMTPDEAHEILGLKPGATREAIIQAHRRLMQRLHPDRGGSDYLAAKINRAKDTLIGA
jgi:DnaJ-domain-containing protein 1